MNYMRDIRDQGRKDAEQELRSYSDKKETIANLEKKLEDLAEMKISIRSARTDGNPVKGGGDGRTEWIVSIMEKEDNANLNLFVAKKQLEWIERGLSALSQTERLILDRFYISRHPGYLERLMDELGFEKTAIYQMKDDALFHYRVAAHGPIMA